MFMKRNLFFLPFLGISILSLLALVVLEAVMGHWFVARSESELSNILNSTDCIVEFNWVMRSCSGYDQFINTVIEVYWRQPIESNLIGRRY